MRWERILRHKPSNNFKLNLTLVATAGGEQLTIYTGIAATRQRLEAVGSMSDMVQRKELGAFLRSRRESMDPAAFGLRPGRRRTPGLRREELAQISGVSVTWYTWLEQAREISVSRQVIEGLARALHLDGPERAHLFVLAGLALPAEDNAHSPILHETLRRLVDAQYPRPAFVSNLWWDLLAYNDSFAALVGGLDDRPAAERNNLWLIFTDASVRGLFASWEKEVRQLVGQLRKNVARYAKDPRGPELVEALRTADPRFTELWQEREVAQFRSSRKVIRHPVLGKLEFEYVSLGVVDNESIQLTVFLAADADTAAKLPNITSAGSAIPR